MYESITIVKVRSAVTVKVPAGGWLLLFNPDQPLHEHLAARAKLVNAGNVNDEFEKMLVGRLQDSTTPVTFVTTKEAAQQKVTQAETAASFTKSNEDAKARQKQMAEDLAAAKQEEHEARVKELNEEHDALRNRSAAKPARTQIEIETDKTPETPAPANEFKAEDLNAKEQGDLLKLADELVKAGRITAPAKTSKSELVKAILAAKPAAQLSTP